MNYDVLDPEKLNKSRAKVGFESVEVQKRGLAKRAIEENGNLGTYNDCMKDFEKTSIKGGYQSQ